MNALELDNIHYQYRDGVMALQGLNIVVKEGQSVGIVGPNGAGKTTLLNVLAGFLKIKNGSIKLFGEELKKDEVSNLRENIGFLFQNADDQLFMPTVVEDVCFGPLVNGEDRTAVQRRAETILSTFGFSQILSRASGHLSAGEKRIAALASIIIMEPRIIALDEPTSTLDPWARRQLLNLLKTLPQTKLIITHDLSAVVECCDVVIIISEGRNVAAGAPRELLAKSKLLEQYRLEVPGELLMYGRSSLLSW